MPTECTPTELAVVTFTFDDGYESTYTEAFPILEKYGFIGTAYVIPSKLGKPGYMTIEQLHKLADAGWEIGSHTMTHPHLIELPLCEVEVELSVSKAWLEGAGFSVSSFATPYGDYNEDILDLIKKYYTTHCTSWPRGINPIPLDQCGNYELKAVWTTADTTVEDVISWIDKAHEDRGWLILIFHRIGQTGEYNWEKDQLEEVVRYVHDNGYWVVLESEMED